MARSDFRFFFPKRVRYAECDPQGIVFNSRYLEYLDIGITEYWRATGIYAQSPTPMGPDFHVARNLVEYRKPVLLDEMIDICLRCSRIGSSSMTVDFEIHGAGADDLRAVGQQVTVNVSEARGAAAPVPDWVARCFEDYEGRSLRAEKAAA
ncbi:acyl-CoA thioesterase [Sphingosinicella soli]|uniref:Acyl-CoA thioester hydrolase n=1 Tax=Sphingosinicella soli TaxID=333708 RepID=A0A7W7B0B6_9SPHN|nr:thioesterase family protein [Sphingosinicella soli]MBB4631514.1 acyl-CoA thioester hydrolase [Sphingosinicella soli]